LILGGYTEINVRHRELNPDTVVHLSTNGARRRLTSLIKANALTTTPDRLLTLFWDGNVHIPASVVAEWQ